MRQCSRFCDSGEPFGRAILVLSQFLNREVIVYFWSWPQIEHFVSLFQLSFILFLRLFYQGLAYQPFHQISLQFQSCLVVVQLTRANHQEMPKPTLIDLARGDQAWDHKVHLRVRKFVRTQASKCGLEVHRSLVCDRIRAVQIKFSIPFPTAPTPFCVCLFKTN